MASILFIDDNIIVIIESQLLLLNWTIDLEWTKNNIFLFSLIEFPLLKSKYATDQRCDAVVLVNGNSDGDGDIDNDDAEDLDRLFL